MGCIARRLLMCSTPSFTGLLDTLALWPVGAWSLRRLTGRYGGPCCLVARMSDQARKTCYFLPDGSLDIAGLLAFAGTADVAVLRLYDQSGHGTYMQNYAGYPLIVQAGVLTPVTAGGVRPGILAMGNTQYLQDDGPQFPVNGPLSRASVNSIPGSAPATSFAIMRDVEGLTSYALRIATAGQYQMYNQGNLFPSSVNLPFNQANSVIENYDSVSGTLIVNGVTTTGSVGPMTNSLDGIMMGPSGASIGGSSIFSEVIQFDQLLGAPDMASIYSDQKQYWSTP